jgi:uncharacterized coiled-coil protein SlyX
MKEFCINCSLCKDRIRELENKLACKEIELQDLKDLNKMANQLTKIQAEQIDKLTKDNGN